MLLQNPGYSVLCLGCLVLFPDPSLFLTLQELPRLSLPKRRSSRKHSPVLTLQSLEFFLDSLVLVANTFSLLGPAGSPISLPSLSTLTLPVCLLPSTSWLLLLFCDAIHPGPFQWIGTTHCHSGTLNPQPISSSSLTKTSRACGTPLLSP